MCHFTNTNSAKPELTIYGLGTTATIAPGISPNCKLRLPTLLNFQTSFCHLRLLLLLAEERTFTRLDLLRVISGSLEWETQSLE